MPIIEIDLTTVGAVPDGTYQAQISKVEYQIKTGEKWNADGTSTVSVGEFINYTGEKRLHLTLTTEKGNVWHDLYLKDSALGFVKSFLRSAGVPYSKKGFDPDDLLGKEVTITLTTVDRGDGYDARQELTVAKA